MSEPRPPNPPLLPWPVGFPPVVEVPVPVVGIVPLVVAPGTEVEGADGAEGVDGADGAEGAEGALGAVGVLPRAWNELANAESGLKPEPVRPESAASMPPGVRISPRVGERPRTSIGYIATLALLHALVAAVITLVSREEREKPPVRSTSALRPGNGARLDATAPSA